MTILKACGSVMVACLAWGCGDGAANHVGADAHPSDAPADAHGVIPTPPDVTYLKSANPGHIRQWFGDAVAMSADGTTLAIGASREWGNTLGVNSTPSDATNTNENNGAVYVFVRGGTGSWTQQAYIKPSISTGNVFFGTSVALSADGSQLAVGAPNYSSPGGDISGNGFVETFGRSGTTWSFQANLMPSVIANHQAFGRAVALSGDGTTFVVGASDGPLYLFTKSGGTWSQKPNLTAADSLTGDVALSADGALLAAGATEAGPCDLNQGCAGRIYTFKLTAGAWSPETSFQGPTATGADHIGRFMGMSGDGTQLASTFGTGLSKVATFAHMGSTWTPNATVPASNTAGYITAIAFSTNGAKLALGAPDDASCSTGFGGDPTNTGCHASGAAYELTRSGSAWSEVYIKAPNTNAGDGFGTSVTLAGDGLTLAVGAYAEQSRATGVNGDESDNTGQEVGAAYVIK